MVHGLKRLSSGVPDLSEDDNLIVTMRKLRYVGIEPVPWFYRSIWWQK